MLKWQKQASTELHDLIARIKKPTDEVFALWHRLLSCGYQCTAELLQSKIKSKYDKRVDTWAALTTAIHFYLDYYNFHNKLTNDENTRPLENTDSSFRVKGLDHTDFHRRVQRQEEEKRVTDEAACQIAFFLERTVDAPEQWIEVMRRWQSNLSR